MEVLLVIWLVIGGAMALYMAFSEGEDSLFVMALVIIFGPIAVVWGLLSTLSDKTKSKAGASVSPKKKGTAAKKEERPPLEEARELLASLSEVFSEKTKIKALKKSHFVQLQRLGKLCRDDIVCNKLDRERVVSILEQGLIHCAEVYGPGNSTGVSRRKSLEQSLTAIDPSQQVEAAEIISSGINSGKWGMPFDVERFCGLWSDWTLVDDYNTDDYDFMLRDDEEYIKVSTRLLSEYQSHDELMEGLKDQIDGLEGSVGALHMAETGLKFYAAEVPEEGMYSGAARCQAPGFHTLFVSYCSKDPMYEALVENMKILPLFFNEPPKLTEHADTKALKRAIKSGLRGHSELRGSIIDGIDDEDNCGYFSKYDLEEITRLDSECWSVAADICTFAVNQNDDDGFTNQSFLAETASLFSLDGFNHTELQTRMITKAVEIADSQEEFLLLADLFEDPESKDILLSRSIEASTHWYDLQKCTEKLDFEKHWAQIEEILKNKVEDEDYASIGNPLDLILECEKMEWISFSDVVRYLEYWLELPGLVSAPDICQSFYLYVHPQDDDLIEARQPFSKDIKRLGDQLFEKSMAALRQADDHDIESFYEFFEDFEGLEDRAVEIKEAHSKVLEEAAEASAAADAERDRYDNICKCAVLVCVGDGQVTAEETQEMEKIRPFVKLFEGHRKAIETLRDTEDIEAARELRGPDMLIHEMVLFTPTYVSEVFEDIEEAEDAEDIAMLVKVYAAKITDELDRRISLWAAEEMASIDGFDEGERVLLNAFAEEWGLSADENRRFFKNIVYPATDDRFEFTDASTEPLTETAKSLDQAISEAGGEIPEELQTLMGAMGCSSFEELARKLSGEEEEIPEDTSPPPIWQALLKSGDWADVREAISNGADVNETMTLKGIEGFSIITLCAEQGDPETLKALIEAGADVDSRPADLQFRGSGHGFEAPLIAALKGERLDHFDILIEAGANPDPFEDGEAAWTPLMQAANYGSDEAVATLISAGVDVNRADHRGGNALKTACHKNSPAHRKTMRRLIRAGIDATKHDREGFAGIHNAVSYDDSYLSTVELLIEEAHVPLDLEITGPLKHLHFGTPLLRALSDGNNEIAEYLARKGGRFDIGLPPRTVFTAIFSGGVNSVQENRLNDPLLWLDRAIEAGAKPTFEGAVSLVEWLINGANHSVEDDEYTAQLTKQYLTNLFSAANFAKNSVEKLESSDNFEEYQEFFQNASDESPNATATYLEVFRDNDFELEWDV